MTDWRQETRRSATGGFWRTDLVKRFKRVFSIKAYRRAHGSSTVFAGLPDDGFGDYHEPVFFDHVLEEISESRVDLEEHLKRIEHEFSGKPEVLLIHAKLIVLLRRFYRTDMVFARFRRLWEAEGDYLLKHLDLRWLLSANDTFLDYSDDEKERLIGCWTVILCNTIKLSETERARENIQPASADVLERYAEPQHLFDGLQSHKTDQDTISNMRQRLERLSGGNEVTARIFWEVFARINEHDTVYRRFRETHNAPRTRWW